MRASLDTAAGFDVTSVSIPAHLADRVGGIGIDLGGHPILAFSPAMLDAIPTKQGRKELLRPFLSRLPLSQLKYHSCHVRVRGIADDTIPEFTLTWTKTPPWPPSPAGVTIVPMMQPQPHVFDDERCAVTNTGLCLAPKALYVSNGMAFVIEPAPAACTARG